MDNKIKLNISGVLQAAPWVEGEIERARPGLAAAVEAVGTKREAGLLGFFDLPFNKGDAAAL